MSSVFVFERTVCGSLLKMGRRAARGQPRSPEDVPAWCLKWRHVFQGEPWPNMEPELAQMGAPSGKIGQRKIVN